ncbi:helix-turn-helix transcriptional regulator [Staphylococcus warneri]|uniref:helix-turn-helix transcriptional regulator n=1 Tax=Staphylococcus warneri TaxID=1292 RepID=UPI003CF539AA
MYALIKQDKVRVQLAVLNMNQTQFAKHVGIASTYFSSIYNGKRISVKTAERIAVALNGNLEDYFKIFIGDREIQFV